MRYLSLFSGIGGFELGIKKAYESLYNKSQDEGLQTKGDSSSSNSLDVQRATCIGYSEIDKYAIQIYERHFNHKNHGDITKIIASELPDFDLLVGGFPCQAFSIAGKRGGFNDTRGTLFFDIARILDTKKPRLFLLENVKGLLSHDTGRTFRTIIATIDELGYDCQWQVLNSKNFGVPQNRERVFIVGHLRGTPRPQVFPITGANPKNIRQIYNTRHDYDRIYETSGIAPTINTGQRGNAQPKIAIPVLTPDRPVKRQNGRRFKTDGEPSFTLTSQDRHGVYDSARIRKLTPLECERLQSYPDGWTSKGLQDGVQVNISDSQRYKTLGNGLTVNVVEEIIKRLFK